MYLIDRDKLINDIIQILHDDVCAPGGHLDPYYVFKIIRDQPGLAIDLQSTCNELATNLQLIASANGRRLMHKVGRNE